MAGGGPASIPRPTGARVKQLDEGTDRNFLENCHSPSPQTKSLQKIRKVMGRRPSLQNPGDHSPHVGNKERGPS